MLVNIPDPWVVLADPGIQDILEVREQGNLLVHQVCRELGQGLEGLEIKTTTKFERSRRIVKFKKNTSYGAANYNDNKAAKN